MMRLFIAFLTLSTLVLAASRASAQESITVPIEVQGATADSDVVDMLVFEGELYLEAGQFRDAVITFTQAVEFAPDRIDCHLGLARSLTAALVAGQVREVRGASVEALRQYRWVLAREPNHPEALRGVQLLSEKYFEGLTVPLATDPGRRSWAAGQAAMRSHNYAEAVKAFAAAAQAEPEVPDAQRALGDAYLGNEQPDEAIAAYRACLALEPENASAFEGLGLAYERLGDVDASVENYSTAFGFDPDSEPTRDGLIRLLGAQESSTVPVEQRLLLGRAQVGAEDYKQGVLTLTQALADTDPERDPEAVKSLGVARYFLGSLDQAEILFLEAYKANPSDNEAAYYLAASQLRQGEVEDGMMVLEQMLQRDPDNPNALRLFGLSLADMPGHEEDAVEVLSRARSSGAQIDNLPCILGTLLMRLERSDEAYREFQSCLEINPEFPGTHLALGILADEQGRRGEAIVHLEQYLEISDNPEPGAYFRLGVAYLRVGRDAEAYRVIEKVVVPALEDTTTEVTDIQMLEMTSFFLATVRRFEDSIFIGEMLLSRDTNNAVYNNNLSMAYADADQNPDRALQLAEKATRLDPDNPGHLDTLGWALIRTRDYVQAEAVLLRSVELAATAGRDDLSEIYYHLGVLYQATNRLDEAHDYLTRAMENPPTPFLAVEIQRLLDALSGDSSAP